MNYTFDAEAREREMKALLVQSDKEIQKQLDLVKEDYKRVFKKELCATCPTGLREAVYKLKNYYNMSQFHLKSPIGQYKIRKGDKFTIHNNNLTDELAIEFLKENNDRIELFSDYPSNWLELCGGKVESEEEREVREAIEAEMAEAEEPTIFEDSMETEEEKRLEYTFEELITFKMDVLREMFPHIKDNKKERFVREALGLE